MRITIDHLRWPALLGNAIAAGALIVLVTQRPDTFGELLLRLMAIPLPLLNVAVLYKTLERSAEERGLRAEVRKAQLRKRLRELDGVEQTEVLTVRHGGCGC